MDTNEVTMLDIHISIYIIYLTRYELYIHSVHSCASFLKIWQVIKKENISLWSSKSPRQMFRKMNLFKDSRFQFHALSSTFSRPRSS